MTLQWWLTNNQVLFQDDKCIEWLLLKYQLEILAKYVWKCQMDFPWIKKSLRKRHSSYLWRSRIQLFNFTRSKRRLAETIALKRLKKFFNSGYTQPMKHLRLTGNSFTWWTAKQQWTLIYTLRREHNISISTFTMQELWEKKPVRQYYFSQMWSAPFAVGLCDSLQMRVTNVGKKEKMGRRKVDFTFQKLHTEAVGRSG